jgi:type IV pilus assembly protein PilP
MTARASIAIRLLAVVGVLSAGVGRSAEETGMEPLPPAGALPQAGPVAIPPSDIKRDPFRPFTVRPAGPKTVPKTPLEQFDIGAMKLVAVIMSATNPKAMVEDTNGLGYTIQIGTRIGRNGGVVRKIQTDQVVVEEEFEDFYGQRKKSEVVLKLQPEGEKKP